MQKQAPSLGRILTMVLFALSCFGLLLFLWVAFGGSTPLNAKGYRVTIPFKQAGQLAQEADVRISGVSVGKVKSITANPHTGNSDVVIELQPKYAPLRRDSRVMLRAKTLLGETYVEVTPGRPNVPAVPDGGRLAPGVVAPTVQLDEITRAFDAKTRAAFGVWQIEQALAVTGRGRDINDSIALLDPLEQEATALTKVLNRDPPALTRLVRNTGIVFSALSARDGQLRSLIQNANTVFATTGKLNTQLAATFVALPTFEKESSLTLDRLVEFGKTTNPLVNELKPVAQQLTPTAQALQKLAPDLNALFTNLDPAISASVKGLPATDQFLKSATPFFSALDPSLAQLTPLLQFVGAYPSELTAFMANTAAATQAVAASNGRQVRYLRTTNPLSPEALTSYPQRVKSNRPNPYVFPRAFDALPGGMIQFKTNQCTIGITPSLAPNTADAIGQTLTNNINLYALSGDPANVPAPPCKQQSDFSASGKTTQYPQIVAGTNPPPLKFGVAP